MQTDSLTQVQDMVTTVAAQVKATVAQQPEVAETVGKFADVGWPEMLLMAGLGFAVVFVVLVLLIYIMKAMGWVFTRQKRAAKVAEKGAAAAAAEEHDAISDQEIAAAIITALKLYKSNLHDQESEIITINRITRAYSPWNSKIHGLTQVPEHK